MPDVVRLGIGGTEFGGWEALTITRTLDSCADAFSLSAPFNPANQSVVNAFRPFGYQRAEVKIDSELVLTGRIELVAPEVSARSRTINVQGRSLTGALIESSIDIGKGEFKGLTLAGIAREICKPHGIEVSAKFDTSEIKAAIPETGQTGFEFLAGLARSYGLLITCDARGRLVIDHVTSAAITVASLAEGDGVLMGATASYDGTQRFSKHKALAQSEGVSTYEGEAEDSGVGIYRPRVAIADCEPGALKAAAEWARSLALSSSCQIAASVSGWRHPGGGLWAPGQAVTLKAPGAFILAESRFLIAEASLSLDTSGGRVSTLRLVFPETYRGAMPGSYPWA